jgi:cell division transport system permease protein
MRRNGSMTFSAISAVSLTLLILGVVLVLAMNVNHLVNEIEDQVEIVVEIKNEADAGSVAAMKTAISAISGVESVTYLSKEAALVDLKNRLGDQGYLLEGLENENPLYNMFTVRVVSPQDTKAVAEQISSIENVFTVDYGEGYVEKLFTITTWVRNIGIIFIIGLAITAMYLISNTIKITITMRSKEIELQKLVGATNSYIRWPFFIEGLLLGVFGAILPIILVLGGYYILLGRMSSDLSLAFINLMSFYPLALQVGLVLLGIGAFIGIWGSLVSVRRFLKI